MKATSTQNGKSRWYPCPKCGDQHPSTTTLLDCMRSIGLEIWIGKNGTAKLNVLDQVIKEMINDSLYGTIRTKAEARWKLKENTAFWRSGKEIGKDTAEEGTSADAWLEAHFNKVPISIESLGTKARSMVENALAWEKEHHVETLFTQKTFYNCALNYAGTCDWGGKVDGELTILDWKRSGSFYANHVMQGWSYALADESENGERLYGKIGIGSLGNKENPIKFFKRTDKIGIEMARNVMIACGNLFRLREAWDKAFPYISKPKEKQNEIPAKA